jgi:hypothetical protein
LDFSGTAKALYGLTGNNKLEWTSGCQTVFNEIKRKLLNAAELKAPDNLAPFRLETDASGYAVGAVLT